MLTQSREHFGDCRAGFGIDVRSAGWIGDRPGLWTDDLLAIDDHS
jgi:hypothetical protein